MTSCHDCDVYSTPLARALELLASAKLPTSGRSSMLYACAQGHQLLLRLGLSDNSVLLQWVKTASYSSFYSSSYSDFYNQLHSYY